ncbi:MAG: flagellar filament capping protein FliD [Myxococcales bacterium]|nr:flagellar filament capping protein FliD [Myxococcales bacterium]
MGIAISGIASGIDSDSIISQLLALETTRIVQIQRKIAVEEQRREAFGSLTGQLEALRSAARKLQDPNLYGQLRASSSDSAVLTVNASAGAREGSYSVQVRQLATRHRVAAQGFVDRAGTAIAAGEGVFAFRVGNGAEVELDVDETTSLQDLADAINDADAGVRADIVNDGSAQNPYRLVLTAEEFGQDGRVTVTANDTTLDFDGTHVEAAVADAANAGDYDGAVLSGGTYTGSDNTTFIVEVIEDGAVGGDARFRLSTDGGLTFDDNGGAGYAVTAGAIDLADGVTIEFEDDGTLRAGDRFTIDVFNPELESPQDAIIAVNGISVRKSSNTIDDVFDGVSFNLQSAAPGRTININVRRETGDVQTALTGLLGAYNGVVGYLNAQFSYDPESGQAEPPLNGDPTARQVCGGCRATSPAGSRGSRATRSARCRSSASSRTRRRGC